MHPASLMGDFVICSLESIIAKQLNLVHSKLQASIEQADFSKMLSVILKKHVAEHIEMLIILTEMLLFKLKKALSCYMYIIVNILPVTDRQSL